MNTAFGRHLFNDEFYEGFGRSARQTYGRIDYDQIRLKSAIKLCVPIFIGFSSHSPMRRDDHCNWLIFYYLTRPGFEGISGI